MVKNSNPREKFVEWKEDQRSDLYVKTLNKLTFTRFFANLRTVKKATTKQISDRHSAYFWGVALC